MNRVQRQYWKRRNTPERFAEMSAAMDDVLAAWTSVARRAIPWVEVWFEDTEDRSDFAVELDSRISKADATKIRSLRADRPEHMAGDRRMSL